MAEEQLQPTAAALTAAQDLGLNAASSKKVLVYQHFHGLIFLTEAEFCKKLDDEPFWKVATYKLPRIASSVEITALDLVPDDERAALAGKPELNVNLADIHVPWKVKIENLLLHKYDILYLISRKDTEVKPDAAPQGTA